MRNALRRRIALLSVLLAPFTMIFCATPTPGQSRATNEYFTGKVMPVKKEAKKEVALALVTSEGREFALLKDDASIMFFTDSRLLKRPMRLTGQLVGDPKVLQVINVHSVKSGHLYEVYYWCDICTIKTFNNEKCACCGDPVELREVLVK